MTLKKITIFCAVALCIFASCKKNSSSSSSDYHVTATIDGQTQSFNVSPLAIRITNAGISMISFEGFAGNQNNPQVMAVSWNNYSSGTILKVGSYIDTSSVYALTAVYNPSVSVSYVSGNGATAGSTSSAVAHLKMTLTSIDSVAVRGTFSGDFYLNGDLSSPKKSITNGDFYVPWKK